MTYRNAEFWSNRVDTYEKQYALDTPMCACKRARKAEILIDWTGMNYGKQVLELGCGTGLFTQHFAMTGCELTATDVSDKMLARTRERVKLNNVTFKLADACQLPFPDESFDVVVAAYLMQHIDAHACIRECRRVLRHNGRVGLIVPNILNPLSFAYACRLTKPLLREKSLTHDLAFWQWFDLLNENWFKPRFEIIEFSPNSVPEALIPVSKAITEFCEALPLVSLLGGTLVIGAEKC